jgi:hypothetical protein
MTKNQQFHLILADIAMAMAAGIMDCTYRIGVDAASYQPGSIRDDWFRQSTDKALNQRVTALANAGVASLSNLPASALLDKAERFGVPLDTTLATEIATHFKEKREAVLTYDR